MYARIDDGFHDHPTVLKMGNEAAGLYARAISYAAHYETDGLVPKDWLDRACGRKRAAIEKLVNAGKIEDHGDDWMLVSFLEYNSSREQAEAMRRKMNERKTRWRDKQTGTRSGTRDKTRDGTVDETRSGTVSSRARVDQTRPEERVPFGNNVLSGPASDAAPADAAALSAGWTVSTSDVLDRCWRCDEQYRMTELEPSGLCAMCAAEKEHAA